MIKQTTPVENVPGTEPTLNITETIEEIKKQGKHLDKLNEMLTNEKKVQLGLKDLVTLAENEALLREFVFTIINNETMKAPIALLFAKARLKQAERDLA